MSKNASNQMREVKAVLDNGLMKSKFNSVLPDPMELLEEKNMNTGYLLTILRLIDEFSLTKIMGVQRGEKYTPNHYYHLYEVLDAIFDLIFCKMSPEVQKNFDNRLESIRVEIDGLFTESEFGTFMDKGKGLRIRQMINSLFRDMLINMDTRGMLTYKSDDPRFAMSKFTD